MFHISAVFSGNSATLNTTPVDELGYRNSVIGYAEQFIGTRYRSGSTNPSKGFDCSGFVTHVLENFSIDIPRSSGKISLIGEQLPISMVRPGDLIFFAKKGRIFHIGMVYHYDEVSGLTMIHSCTSRGVVVENVTNSDYWRPKLYTATNIISSKLFSTVQQGG